MVVVEDVFVRRLQIDAALDHFDWTVDADEEFTDGRCLLGVAGSHHSRGDGGGQRPLLIKT